MLTVALSLLFGLVAFAALAQIYLSVSAGMRRGRQILAELAADEGVRPGQLGARPLRSVRPAWRLARA
jgi:hypothetical protein